MNRNLGYQKEHIVTIGGEFLINSPFKAVKNELQQNPKVLGVTASFHPPTNVRSSTGSRNFSKSISTDKKSAFIINEEAAKLLGTDSSLGKSFRLHRQTGRVIGVVENFHFRPLHFQIEPMVLRVAEVEGLYHHIFIKVNSTDIPGAISFIKSTFNKFNPGYPLEYGFLDESFQSLYRAEERTNKLFRAFTFLAIFISCLGLFGLTAFLAEQRTREIGIRKVLGASISNIIGLFSKEFILPVTLANIIAWPVSFYVMRKWLNGFAYRANMTIGVYLISSLAALFIAFITVSSQALKSASKNPTDSLRSE